MTTGVVRTIDTGGLPPSMLDAISDAGGLWYAGDYYAKPDVILRTAREAGVRALRVDARDLSWLSDLPDLEFLHVRTDGRPPLDPIRDLRRLRALTVEVGAVRGTIDLEVHKHLRWLKIKLSGKGGAANLPGVLAGHPGLTHLRLSEVPFADLAELATAFPSLTFLEVHGADQLKKLGDVSAWRRTLRGLGFIFPLQLRTLEGIEVLDLLEYLGISFGTLGRIDSLTSVGSLRYLQLVATYPSLVPLSGHPRIKMARLAMPTDGILDPLRTLPSLVALSGEKWIGRPVDRMPLLEDLAPDHPLCVEWQRSTAG